MSKCERAVSSCSKLGNERYLEKRDLDAPADRVEDQNRVKKRKIEVARRFGMTGLPDSKHNAPIDGLHIKVEAEMTSLEDEGMGTSSSATTDASREQSTVNVAKQRMKGSVLDAFDPNKHSSNSKSQASSSHIAQYNSNAQLTTQTLTAALILTFHGTNVFAGIRTLAKMGFVDLDKNASMDDGRRGCQHSDCQEWRYSGWTGR